MHIYLVNDDGIGSKGIMALLRAACARGHQVSMCAPAQQQSAASHRITLTEPIFVHEFPVDEPNAKAYAIDGSPTDCVRVGLLQVIKDPVDMLISGINEGYNAGMAVHYSGTVGAAMEGTINGIKSIAASIHHFADQEMIDHFANLVIETAERYLTKETRPFTILNINAPNVKPSELKEPVYAPLATSMFLDNYERRVAPRIGDYYWLMSGAMMEEFKEGTDSYYLDQGHIAFTVIGNPMCLSKEQFDDMGLI